MSPKQEHRFRHVRRVLHWARAQLEQDQFGKVGALGFLPGPVLPVLVGALSCDLFSLFDPSVLFTTSDHDDGI